MTSPIFTPEEEAVYQAQAQQRGYTDLREYVRALISEDAKAKDEIALAQPSLDELMAMSPEERTPYLEAAAALMEEEYRTNPELTITVDTVDLYDYPDA